MLGRALLDPADVQRSRPEVHLIPPQVYKLRSPQAVPIGHEDHGSVPVPPAVLPGGAHQPLDLSLSQVLAGAQVRVGAPPGRDCSFCGGWRDQLEMRLRHVIRLSPHD